LTQNFFKYNLGVLLKGSFYFALEEVIIVVLDGVVRQTSSGMVMECTNAQKCFFENGGSPKGKERNCLLSVNHGDRCQAWESDGFKYLIDVDQSKIKQLP
jgi:hypothetical protein